MIDDFIVINIFCMFLRRFVQSQSSDECSTIVNCGGIIEVLGSILSFVAKQDAAGPYDLEAYRHYWSWSAPSSWQKLHGSRQRARRTERSAEGGRFRSDGGSGCAKSPSPLSAVSPKVEHAGVEHEEGGCAMASSDSQ
mmetsp:Transcript_5008/g.10531  ORF Transcript_5008/g.10531 Transcript_5008/m.10531 type:complete len:138 (-) Transcript_5008:139-552(-)